MLGCPEKVVHLVWEGVAGFVAIISGACCPAYFQPAHSEHAPETKGELGKLLWPPLVSCRELFLLAVLEKKLLFS